MRNNYANIRIENQTYIVVKAARSEHGCVVYYVYTITCTYAPFPSLINNIKRLGYS